MEEKNSEDFVSQKLKIAFPGIDYISQETYIEKFPDFTSFYDDLNKKICKEFKVDNFAFKKHEKIVNDLSCPNDFPGKCFETLINIDNDSHHLYETLNYVLENFIELFNQQDNSDSNNQNQFFNFALKNKNYYLKTSKFVFFYAKYIDALYVFKELSICMFGSKICCKNDSFENNQVFQLINSMIKNMSEIKNLLNENLFDINILKKINDCLEKDQYLYQGKFFKLMELIYKNNVYRKVFLIKYYSYYLMFMYQVRIIIECSKKPIFQSNFQFIHEFMVNMIISITKFEILIQKDSKKIINFETLGFNFFDVLPELGGVQYIGFKSDNLFIINYIDEDTIDFIKKYFKFL